MELLGGVSEGLVRDCELPQEITVSEVRSIEEVIDIKEASSEIRWPCRLTCHTLVISLIGVFSVFGRVQFFSVLTG